MQISERIKQLALLTNNSLIGSAASYFLSIFLANKLGVSNFGLYSYILVLSSFSVIFINWSVDQTASSYFSEGFSKEELFNLVLVVRFFIFILVSIPLIAWKDMNFFIFLSTMAINISAFNLSFIFEIGGKNSIYSYIYMFERLLYVICVVLAIYLGFNKIHTIITIYFVVVIASLIVQYGIYEKNTIKNFAIPNHSKILYLLKRNFSMVIISFSAFVYGGISRLFIQDKLGLSALGVFSSGMQITVLASIIQAQVERIWRLPLFKAFSEKNIIKIKLQIFSFLKFSTLPFILMAFLLFFLSDYLVDTLFSKDYSELKKVLPIISIFFVTINLTSLLNICWFAMKKSNEYLISSVIMSGILIVLFFLIKRDSNLITFLFCILICQIALIIYSIFRIFREIKSITQQIK